VYRPSPGVLREDSIFLFVVTDQRSIAENLIFIKFLIVLILFSPFLSKLVQYFKHCTLFLTLLEF